MREILAQRMHVGPVVVQRDAARDWDVRRLRGRTSPGSRAPASSPRELPPPGTETRAVKDPPALAAAVAAIFGMLEHVVEISHTLFYGSVLCKHGDVTTPQRSKELGGGAGVVAGQVDIDLGASPVAAYAKRFASRGENFVEDHGCTARMFAAPTTSA